MAIKRGNDFRTFTRNWKGRMLNVDNAVLNKWQLETENVLVDAQKQSPVASGTLEGSGSSIRAKLTPNGIVSFVQFIVPYAKKLNDKNSGLKLKEVGQVSYYAGGVKVKKRRKGILGFLDLAVNKNEKFFTKILKDEIGDQFLKI